MNSIRLGSGLLALLLLVTLVQSSAATSTHDSSATKSVKLVIGVDGGTESIRACCFDATTGVVIGKSCAVAYPTYHPQPGWAEQDPNDWYENLGAAVRGAVDSLKTSNRGIQFEILGICLDTTCCSVVALDDDFQPLRNTLLWMDARSAPQTEQILDKCRGDPALNVNCGGEGPLSAEWMTPKCLWIRENEPAIWEKARTICEYQDYLNYKLTGEMCASSCNAASRWHWDGEACVNSPLSSEEGGEEAHSYPGRPMSLYKKLGIPELATKLPRRCLPMGTVVGHLTADASMHLNLPQGLPVLQGGPDAFVGMVGLGCVHAGQLCLITGSSHLHCVVSSKPTTSKGTWGAYRGAPLPGLNFAEGGQSSTGSIIRWAKKLFGASDVDYEHLDTEAKSIPPGCDGLIALETFQGSRTPVTDPMARGALLGLTLSHTRAHVWRAFMEAVCFGTRACMDGLEAAGHACNEIVIAGGATRSDLWLQMHADVTGKPVVVCENADAPLLGCAILASVGVGIHDSVGDAVKAMVRTARRVEPSKEITEIYSRIYANVYSQVGGAVRPVVHSIASLRGGETSFQSDSNPEGDDFVDVSKNRDARLPAISPSLLACDWANIKEEVDRCIEAGTKRLHVDIFDGVFLDSPYAFTFGPQMVAAIRRCASEAVLDLHMCVERPSRYVDPMKKAGGDTFIFQWEAVTAEIEGDTSGPSSLPESTEAAIQLAKQIVDTGMECGVSVNPSTDIQAIFPLLRSGLVSLVDVLAVEPGFGGQEFQSVVLQKIQRLRKFCEAEENRSTCANISIMVDGGINEKTAPLVSDADILVAGTFLFRHPVSLANGVNQLRRC